MGVLIIHIYIALPFELNQRSIVVISQFTSWLILIFLYYRSYICIDFVVISCWSRVDSVSFPTSFMQVVMIYQHITTPLNKVVQDTCHLELLSLQHLHSQTYLEQHPLYLEGIAWRRVDSPGPPCILDAQYHIRNRDCTFKTLTFDAKLVASHFHIFFHYCKTYFRVLTFLFIKASIYVSASKPSHV